MPKEQTKLTSIKNQRWVHLWASTFDSSFLYMAPANAGWCLTVTEKPANYNQQILVDDHDESCFGVFRPKVNYSFTVVDVFLFCSVKIYDTET